MPGTLKISNGSTWPRVVNDGVRTRSAGIVATPATRATTVVTRMLITSAALILSVHRTIVRTSPIQNTKSDGRRTAGGTSSG